VIPCKFHTEEIHVINASIYLAASLRYYSSHDRPLSGYNRKFLRFSVSEHDLALFLMSWCHASLKMDKGLELDVMTDFYLTYLKLAIKCRSSLIAKILHEGFRFSYVYQMFSPYRRLFLNVIPMHPTDKPTGYGSSSRRSNNYGIVDECCFQSCELRRLEMYCAPVKTGKTPRSLRAQRHTDITRTAKVCSHILVMSPWLLSFVPLFKRAFDTIIHFCKTLGQIRCIQYIMLMQH